MFPGERPGLSSPGRNAISGARSSVKDRVSINSVSARPRETPCAGATPVAPREVFSVGAGRESTAPGAASAARAGVRVSFAGRSAVLRGRFGPACLRDALRCSCLAVACGDPGVSCDMGRRPLVRRRWRRASPFPARQGMPPPPARPPRSPRQVRLRSRTLLVPSRPASRQMVSRSRRTAVSGCLLQPFVTARRIRRSAPIRPSIERHGASVPTGCIPPCDPRYWRIGIAWHLGVGGHKLWPPRQLRIPADCPVARSDRDGSRPTAPGRPQTAGNIHLAPKRHQKRMFSSLAAAGRNADLAPRHYRNSAAPIAAVSAVRAVVTGRDARLHCTNTQEKLHNRT